MNSAYSAESPTDVAACCASACLVFAHPAALQAADVVVVIAGVDSGLPGVVCGLVDAPVIAVPTSNGASNGLQGLGNLVAAVSSCAPGVAVVNVDGTVPAAVMAARILRTAAARVEKLTAAAAAAAPVAAAPANGIQRGAVANNVVPAFEALALPTTQAAAAV
jgi:phosphoribosylcarboxyaminoimidazole (NCAIR) mutase